MSKQKQCDKLTPQQRLFCNYRYNNPNWKAYECVHAAYPNRFSTDASAMSFASTMLRKEKIIKYLDELSRRVQQRVGSSIGRILFEEALIAFSDPAELIDPNTREVLPIYKVPKRMRAAIASLKIIKTQSLRDPDIERTEWQYKLWDKGAALARLEKMHGMYEADNLQRKPDPAETPKAEKWVMVPTDRELTLKEWAEQVEELNRHQEQKRKAEAEAEA